ncbi:MAG TPA: 50S ribosomal protein L23 [Gammaproteobacteria bacterium]|nr:50S ribosomal protein L23 [Gammaproteobacteria bacterium]HCZ48911.1 50S ribosomal protein L23 [Gammaproteobacteria bacterium]MCH78349.1 50S ribosomal protein L23 [Gammaproteobacteria bacterium]
MVAVNEARLLEVIRAPHISEKGTRVAEKYRQIVFRVAPDASKDEIKAAVEHAFSVKVQAVQTLRMKGKTKRTGRRKDWKKSYVTLAPGHDIDFTGVA